MRCHSPITKITAQNYLPPQEFQKGTRTYRVVYMTDAHGGSESNPCGYYDAPITKMKTQLRQTSRQGELLVSLRELLQCPEHLSNCTLKLYNMMKRVRDYCLQRWHETYELSGGALPGRTCPECTSIIRATSAICRECKVDEPNAPSAFLSSLGPLNPTLYQQPGQT